VHLRPGYDVSEDDVIIFLKEHGVETGKITKWMLPRLIAITTGIPKTSVGKYNKKAIRENIDKFVAIAKDMSHHHN